MIFSVTSFPVLSLNPFTIPFFSYIAYIDAVTDLARIESRSFLEPLLPFARILYYSFGWFLHIMDLSDIAIEVTRPSEFSTPTIARRTSLHIPRKTSWGTPIPPPSSKTEASMSREDLFDNVDLSAGTPQSKNSANPGFNTLRNIAALGLSFTADDNEEDEDVSKARFSLDEDYPYTPEANRPFNKWMKTLQRRAADRRKTVSCDVTGDILEKEIFETPNPQRRSVHKKSSSASSYGFVTAVKSASISLASFSVAPRSRRTGVSSRQQRTDRSSKASNAGRLSEDNSYLAGTALDQAVTNRLLQRRRVLEEIISTEESYLADVKFLMNVSYN